LRGPPVKRSPDAQSPSEAALPKVFLCPRTCGRQRCGRAFYVSGRGRRLPRKLNEGHSSGVPPFKCTPARSSTLRACSWYFTASEFSRSDTDRYPPNCANSLHLRDIARSRAAVAIASRWSFVRVIDAPGTTRLTDPPSRKWVFARLDMLSGFG